MPVYKIRAPDGKLYRYRVDAKDVDPEDVLKSFNQQFALRSALESFQAPKEKAGFFGSFKEAVTSLGLTDEAAAFAANPTEENRKAFLKAAESKYKSVGGFGKGENWEAFKELLGGSLGALAAPIGAAVVGGGLPGFAGASAAQYTIANLQRQAEAQQAAAEAGQPVPQVDLSSAAVAAAAQTGLDIIPGALILKGLRKFPIAQHLLAKDETSNKAAQVLIDAFKNKNLSLKGNVAKGVGLGVAFEVPQEIAQQALERWQAGLSLTDDEAKEEFKQAAIGAAVLGGAFGAVGGAGTYRGMKAEEARKAAERQVPPPVAPPVPPPVVAEEPAAPPEETEDEREARLEREAIQAYEREREDAARLEAATVDTRTAKEMGVSPEEPIARDKYDQRTLREAAEAEALAPKDEEAPQVKPAKFVAPSDFRYTLVAAPNYGLEALSPEDADFELEVLQQQAERGRLTPQNFAQSEIGARLDTSQIVTINEGLRSDPVNTIKTLRDKLAPAAEPEVPDVSRAATAEETDRGAGGRGPDLFTLRPSPSESGAARVEPAGVEGVGVPAGRPVSGETEVSPALVEPEGEATTLAPEYKFGRKAPKEEVLDLRERAINFIRETGKGSAVALQKELGVSMEQAKILRDSLLGSGAVVQKGNVKGAKGGANYFVVEGKYTPTTPAAREVVEPETDQEKETAIEEARQRATARLRATGARAEAARADMDKAAEAAAARPKVTVEKVPQEVITDEIRRAFADLEAEQAAAKQRPEAAAQQGLDLLGGVAKPTLSNVERKMLDDIKSAARYLIQSGQMSLDAVDKFNQELRKPLPDVRKLRKMIDKISSKESAFEAEEQADLDQEGFIISDNFKDTVQDADTISRAFPREEREARKPLDFNEQIVYFRNKALNRFKKRKSQVKGMRLETVRNLINRLTAGWKNPPNIVVVQSHLDLPPELDPEGNADSMGVARGNDVYIIANNIRHISDLKATVFHESLGHYGLEQLFGERLFQTMLDIYRTNKRVQADADAWLAENPDVYPESEFTADERNALAAEEVLAEVSEGGPIRDPQMRAAFNRVAALVRKFARALARLIGQDLSYSNREIADIVAQAHNKVISGKTRLIPRYNNVRYMKTYYNKILKDSIGYVQNKAPEATREILTGNVRALSNLPNSLRNAKLASFSLHHMMQLFEKYAPAFRALNNLVERKAYDATNEMLEHTEKAGKYREVLRQHTQYVDEFNKVAQLINLAQTPVLEEQLNANGEFERFVPNVAAQRMRNIPLNSAAYNALSPDEKVLHEAVNRFYALPNDVQQVIADVYTDYRNYSDRAFKVKLNQLLNRLPAQAVAQIKANFQRNRLKFYLPLPREGMYKLVYLDNNGIRVSEFFSSLAERDYAEQKVQAQGLSVLTNEPKVLQQRNYQDGTPLPPGLLKELLTNVEESLQKSGVPATDIEKAKETVFDTFIEFMPGAYGNDLRQEISSRKTFMLNGVMYYGRLGYNEDVIGAYEKRIPGIIYQINNLKYTLPFEKVRRLIKEQLTTYRANKGSARYAGLEDLDDDYLQSLKRDLDERITFAKSLQQYSPYVYTISKANYIYSIALNISSALINTTILPMMAWPAMAAKYGPVNAARAVGQAIQLFFSHSYRNPQTGQIDFNYKRLADMPASFGGINMPNNYAQTAHGKEFARFHRTLLARSVVGTAAEQELNQAQNISVSGYEGLSAKVNLAMSYVFRSSERMNREVTSLAAYMLARNIDVNGQPIDPNRQGLSVGKASEEAIRLNYDVNGATTPETNSRLYQTDIGRIVLTFRTHALNMILNLAFSFNQAIESINANQPNAAERRLLRSIARKKLLYIFGSTYMLAGIKGLPLFGAAEVLASLLMGDDDEPYDLEQEVLDAVGTLGLNGPVNELLNIDVSSRTGFYGLIWRDDPKRLAEVGLPVYVLERVAGPTYGLVEAARRGFNDLADGEIVRASEALTPAPIRNMIKGMRYGIEGAQTRDGLPIVEDVNAYNTVMQILGFAPADLATAQAQRGATYEISEKIKNRRTALLTNLYAARKAGNSEAIGKAMDDIRNYNAANPAYAIKGSTITKSYEERERRAREALMGMYQPKNLRMATSKYVTDLNEEDEDAFF